MILWKSGPRCVFMFVEHNGYVHMMVVYIQSLPADMPAARRDVEIKSRKDESKLQQGEAVQEFTRRQHEFLETDIRKVQRYQLLQLGNVEQKQNQEVWHISFLSCILLSFIAVLLIYFLFIIPTVIKQLSIKNKL